ncbi:hypothetical protein FACS1894205_3530 [Alphaproteobacteria bacterium]|nr:hypothetical protein FACS1894205_3530 [Alphaproteobacteria bacterium]
MKWRKLGIIFAPPGGRGALARSHAQVPTPLMLNDDVIRVYYSAWDDQGRSRPFFVDLKADDPTCILQAPMEPLLDLGKPGCFDDNGVLCCSVVKVKNDLYYMYYVGFEILKNIRYRLFTGLAISEDSAHFTKYSSVPILDRTQDEFLFRGGPFVSVKDNIFHMYYVAGSDWMDIDGKAMPVYTLKYMTSRDGICWPEKGQDVFPAFSADEHGFGRPWLFHDGRRHELHYSVRRISLGAYRLGFAVSGDGAAWDRRDAELGLECGPDDFDAHAIMYSAAIAAKGKIYCFYNGDNFGEKGIALAVRED